MRLWRSPKLQILFYFHYFIQLPIAAAIYFVFAKSPGTAKIIYPIIYFTLAQLVQLWLLIHLLKQSKFAALKTTTLKYFWISFRYSIFTLLAVILYFFLDSLIAKLLLSAAKSLELNEIHRQIFVWLRAPLSLFISQIIMSTCDGWIIFCRLPVIKQSITSTPKQYSIQLDNFFYSRIFLVHNRLFISENLEKKLLPEELDYLIKYEHAKKTLRQPFKRALYSSGLQAFLLLPYLVAVQLSIYHLKPDWIIPAWIALYVALFGTQISLLTLYKRNDETERNQFTIRQLGVTPEFAQATHQKLAALNVKLTGLPMIFSLPYEKHLVPKMVTKKISSLGVQASLAVTLAIIFIFGCYISFKPNYDLRVASETANIKVVRELLNAGVSPNAIDYASNGLTPLLAAAQKNNYDIVALLINNGADPNRAHPMGLTPLLLASEHGSLSIVRLLVEWGASITARGLKGLTPLLIAASHGQANVVQFLIEHGADINEKTAHGSTALMLATQSGHLELVALLIQKGADINLKDQDNDTALILARRKGFAKISRLIENELNRIPAKNGSSSQPVSEKVE